MEFIVPTLRCLAIVILILILTGCATPVTVLKNPKIDQAVACGGGITPSILLGVAGYNIQEKSDADCVEKYKEQGFETK